MAVGVMITGSRSGGMGVGVAIISILLMRSQGRVLTAVLVVVLIMGTLVVLQSLPPTATVIARYTDTSLTSGGGILGFRPDQGPLVLELDPGRQEMWRIGLDMFIEHPLGGVGLGNFDAEARARAPFSAASSPHSGLNQLLAETGLLGTVPFLILIGYVFLVLIRRAPESANDLDVWRIVFLAAFAGMITSALFNTYHFERYFWIPVAFAALIESVDRRPKRSKSKGYRLSNRNKKLRYSWAVGLSTVEGGDAEISSVP